MKKITCYGEVLWDVFPSHKKIGGAPLNVALRTNTLGHEVSIISKVGNDQEGTDIINFIAQKNLSTDYIQTDAALKTGCVDVVLNEEGSATYDIKHPCAWDYIDQETTAMNAAKEADVFVFGSLIARSETSRKTLKALLKVAKFKFFDVNLRPPFYTKDTLKELMLAADFIKFNDSELFEIAALLHNQKATIEENMVFIAQKTNTKHICVTKGKQGAVLYYDEVFYYNKGYHVNVVDTVGAGDSFLASLISKLINDASPQDAIDFACAVGALVASREGANPNIAPHSIDALLTSI